MLSFLRKIKTYLQKQDKTFLTVFSILVIIRLVYVFLPAVLWWDASVYIGMGKYLASGGSYGLWEYFRPPLLPVLFSIGEFTNIGIVFWSKLLTFLASLLSLILIYRIGEKIRVNAGIWAMFALGVSTIFLSFTNIQMTEVFGVFFSLIPLYLFVYKKSPLLLGISVGLCLLLRFPYGILLPLFGCALLCSNYFQGYNFRNLVITSFKYAIGFLIIVIPYLTLNHILYGDILAPFIAGNEMITGYLWLYSQSMWFYPKIIFYNNIVFVLSFIPLFYLFKKDRPKQTKIFIYLMLAWIILFLGYFTYQVHKEGRYIIPVFPAFALLSGLALSYLRDRIDRLSFFAILSILGLWSIAHGAFYIEPKENVNTIREFYQFLGEEKNTKLISSSPVVSAYTQTNFIPAYNSWEHFGKVYKEERKSSDYGVINSCELHVCTPGEEELCKKEKEKVLAYIESNDSVIYSKLLNKCELIITKIDKNK